MGIVAKPVYIANGYGAIAGRFPGGRPVRRRRETVFKLRSLQWGRGLTSAEITLTHLRQFEKLDR
jgi:hypothetical protein